MYQHKEQCPQSTSACELWLRTWLPHAVEQVMEVPEMPVASSVPVHHFSVILSLFTNQLTLLSNNCGWYTGGCCRISPGACPVTMLSSDVRRCKASCPQQSGWGACLRQKALLCNPRQQAPFWQLYSVAKARNDGWHGLLGSYWGLVSVLLLVISMEVSQAITKR